jgi:two-component system, LuxR family, sensor kinase FixL
MAGVSAKLPSLSGISKVLLLGMVSLVLPLWATLVATSLTAKYQRDRVQSEFAMLASENEKALLHRIDSYAHALHGAAGLFYASENVSFDKWRRYVQALDIGKNFPGIRGIGYVQEVELEDLAEFGERMRKGGAPDFSIRPDTYAALYFIVSFFEPLKGNEQALGLNIAFEENRREAAIRSRDTGQPAITGRVLLVQDQTKPGFVLLHPMYRRGVPLDTVEQRRAAFLGWILTSFGGENLLQGLTQSQGRLIDLSLYDGQEITGKNLIYSSATGVAAGASPQGADSVRRQIKVMQQTWTLVWTSTPAFESTRQSNAALLVFIGGLTASLSIAAFLVSASRRAKIVERLVVEKTKELAAGEEQFKLLIRHTPAAVAMFDRQMRYIMMSDRWVKDYGLEGREILGRTHYEIFPEILQNDAWIDWHRRALNGESLSKEEDGWERADGRTEWVKWAIHPWIDSSGQVGGIVMFTEVITAKKESERRSNVIREIAIEAAEAASVQDILKLALDKLHGYLGWPMGHAYLWAGDRAFEDSVQIWHIEPQARRRTDPDHIPEIVAFALQSRLHGRVITERKPVFVEGPSPEGPGMTDRHHPRSGVGVPIIVGNRVVAVLEFYTPDQVAEDRLLPTFFEIISLQLARAIERRQAEDALKESEERYQRAVRGSSVGLWEWNIITGDLYWSPRLLEIAGLSAANFSRREDEFEKCLHPEDRERFSAAIQAHLTDQAPFGVEYRLLRPGGAVIWVHSRGQASWDSSGKPLRMSGSTDDISERKRTESALEEAHRLKQAILASTTSLVIATDDTGNVILFNTAAEAALGYTAAEVIGKPMPVIYDRMEMICRAAQLSREQRVIIEPGFQALVHKARLHGADTQEWTFIRKCGGSFVVDLTVTTLLGGQNTIAGFLCVIDDISERLAQQQALKDRELRLRNIIDKAVDGLIVADLSGTIEIFNPACERMFGYSAAEVIGKSLEMLMPDNYRDLHNSAMKLHNECHQRKVVEFVREVEGKRKDGGVFPIDLSISDVSLPGRRIFSGIIRDVSQRKETERKLLAYAAELERSNRELDEFAYVASHDLKAPLRVIGNASRWLEEDLAEHLTNEDRANMDLLRSRVYRMEKLLDDLLTYSRVGRASDSRFDEVVNGKTLIGDILLLLSPPPGFTIQVLPDFADIELKRMPVQQVLYNLIGNAIKHHHKETALIEIGVEDAGDMYRFTVRDDGPGIPANFHEQVFKMFQTLKPRDQVEGSGMGLAYVKKTVGYFGGEIGLVSEEGGGAAFSFTWPKHQKAVGEMQWKAA